MSEAELRYSAEALENFIGQAFEAVGLPANDAAIVAQIMADIDLSGGSGTFGAAVLMLMFTFGGYELITIPAGEARSPRRPLRNR